MCVSEPIVLMGLDWREVEPFWFEFPSQLRRTETLKGDTFLITFWSKKKPPLTENCFESKMHWYTATLEMEPKIGFGPSTDSFWQSGGFSSKKLPPFSGRVVFFHGILTPSIAGGGGGGGQRAFFAPARNVPF